jgi:hypothetical protein
MSYELANNTDEQILETLLNTERYYILKSYDIHIQLFYKYGKKDKDGYLKTPALQKNGKAIYAQTKIVSAFNRITDETDVKIILNKDIWDDLSEQEKTAVLDDQLHYIQIKEDKDGEPIMISEDSDKVQLKLRKPDFYCEGFLDILNIYQKHYIPWQEAQSIVEKVASK